MAPRKRTNASEVDAQNKRIRTPREYVSVTPSGNVAPHAASSGNIAPSGNIVPSVHAVSHAAPSVHAASQAAPSVHAASQAAPTVNNARAGANIEAAGSQETRRCYARLLRLNAEPVTQTLPNIIPLQGPGEDDTVISMGRSANNDYQLACPRLPSLLSRYHAKIIVRNNTHYVIDENTTNGTYVSFSLVLFYHRRDWVFFLQVNGSLIPSGPCELKSSDIVSFGGPTNVSESNYFCVLLRMITTSRRFFTTTQP